MMRRWKHWLWQGTLDPRWEPLEVAGGSGTPEEEDLLGLLTRQVRLLVKQIDDGREMLEKRRALELAGPRGGQAPSTSPGGDDMKPIARSLLPSLDALDRIVEFGECYPNADEVFRNWLTSIKAMRTRLTKTLEGIGLVSVSAIGAEVNLEIHDVVSVVPAKDYLPNTVVAEQQKGYYFRGKLLRDAKVVVAQ